MKPWNAEIDSWWHALVYREDFGAFLAERRAADPCAFDAIRVAFEETICKHAPADSLIDPFPATRKYCHHCVALASEVFSRPYFAHVTNDKFMAAIGHGYREWSLGFKWKQPPRWSFDEALYRVHRECGERCGKCGELVFEAENRYCDGLPTEFLDRWNELGACRSCTVGLAEFRKSHHRQAAARENADVMRRIQQAATEARRVKLIEEIDGERRQRRAATRRRRILEKAAFELVKSMGLIDTIRTEDDAAA